jgi:hypothetical protein
MNSIALQLVALAAVIIVSCSPEEPLIGSVDDQWQLVVSDTSGTISTYALPSPSGPSRIWSDRTDSALFELRRFRDRLYVLHSERPWIVVFDADTVRVLDTIELDAPARTIAFANATTAFVTLPTEQRVDVIDLTVGVVARRIAMPSRPIGIDANGNQLCVTMPDSNAVAIIDSRTLAVESVVGTAPVPWLVASDPSSSSFCIVSLGNGKIDNGTRSSATMQFLNASTRTVNQPLELSPRGGSAQSVVPTGLVVTDNQLAFVTCNSGLLRVSTRTRNRVTTVQTESLSALSFDSPRDLIYAQQDSPTGGIVVYGNNGDVRRQVVPINARSTSIVGVLR